MGFLNSFKKKEGELPPPPPKPGADNAPSEGGQIPSMPPPPPTPGAPAKHNLEPAPQYPQQTQSPQMPPPYPGSQAPSSQPPQYPNQNNLQNIQGGANQPQMQLLPGISQALQQEGPQAPQYGPPQQTQYPPQTPQYPQHPTTQRPPQYGPPKTTQYPRQQRPQMPQYSNQPAQEPSQPEELPRMQVPEELPKMPVIKEVSTNFSEIPFFHIDKVPELEELPVMDVEETENYTFRYREPGKPIFVRTDDYSQIMTNVDTMRSYVDESSEKIYMLENLKKNADMEHTKYKQALEDIQRKLIYVDRVLFES